MNARIKDVAALAGVSTATVSHVLNETRFVREETKKRVLEAIGEIGYTPNANARNLASGSSRTIGLIISDITNPFFPDLVKAIQNRALDHGYEVIVTNTDYAPEHEASCVQRLLELRVNGVIVMTTEQNNAGTERLLQSRMPTIFLDIGEAGRHCGIVRVDYEAGIRSAVEHLLELGHRNIAFINGPNEFMSARIRCEAFVSAMQSRQAALQTQWHVLEGDFRLESGVKAVRQIMTWNPRPTAIVAASDLMALGALSELKHQGLRLPQDCSLIGFDDIWQAELSDPPLTTIVIPRAELGRVAVEELLAMTGADDGKGKSVQVATRLMIRRSTGLVPSSANGSA